MSERPAKPTASTSIDPSNKRTSAALVDEVEFLCRSSRTRESQARFNDIREDELETNDRVRLTVARATALFHLGDVIEAVRILRDAVQLAKQCPLELQFLAALALFDRSAGFLPPEAALQELSAIRQLATSIGDAPSLAALHLAVARVEAWRGLCLQARQHVEIARRLADQGQQASLQCSVGLVESGLELVVGNLTRAKQLAESTLLKAEAGNLVLFALGCRSNLGTIAIYGGHISRARTYLDQVVSAAEDSDYVRAGALDALAQLALYQGDFGVAQQLIDSCRSLDSSTKLPAPSWSQLSHELTQCYCLETRGDWRAIVERVQLIDGEVRRRQFRAIRAPLLCIKARAHAHLGEHERSNAALASAVRWCPQGAVDPLIVLEASRGTCLASHGEFERSAVHFARALAACRNIGHKYYERWIERVRDAARPPSSPRSPVRRQFDLTSATLLLSDVTTILGAGHSVDLLTHRTAAVLEGAFPDGRVDVRSESGLEYRTEFSSQWEQTADGTFRIRIRGSDRAVAIQVRNVQTLDEVSLVKSVADLVRAAVHRTSDGGSDDDEQHLWPRSLVPGSDDAVFQSPRMIELMKIAMRLATTDLPILIGGETGTGKEIFARLIHEHSRVKRGPFVAYNCAAMPRDLVESQLFGYRRGAFTGATDSFPGLVRAAEHGTLFLDEVADLDAGIQPKLLRFLEGAEIHPIGEMKSQRVPVRIVAATNANLDGLVEEGRFRRDLFYRLGVARLSLPPLRERKDEIPALASLFLARYSRECCRTGVRLGDDLIAALLLYDWPGNIRQLANEIRRVVAMADDGEVLHSAALAPDITAAWNNRSTVPPADAKAQSVVIRLDQPLDKAIEELERTFVDRAMESASGRVAEAAQLLGISRKGLFLKRRRWGLVDDSQPPN